MSAVATIATTLLRRQQEVQLLDEEDCTFELCDINESHYGYQPSFPANVALVAIFGVSLAAYLVQGVVSKRFIGFSIAMVLGVIGEIIGYVGRIMMHDNPWKEIPFMIQICCLTIAPAFLAAGIYFCLSRIVITFGVDNSRIRSTWYPRIFIPCDVVSLLLQAAGGGISASADNDKDMADMGTNIMIAGLVFQVVTLTAFIALVTDFSIRTLKRMRSMGTAALDPRHAGLRNSFPFRGFLCALSLSTLCIYIRCIYRVAELSGGWDGELIKHEIPFIILEGVMIVIACLVLNVFHPGLCFKAGYDNYTSVEMKGRVTDSESAEVPYEQRRVPSI